jgi:hypothetical protein
MKRFIQSFYKYGYNKEWSIVVQTQCYSNEDINLIKQVDIENKMTIEISNERIAPYIGKVNLLKKYYSDIYCTMDDDCNFLSETKIDNAINFCLKKDVGIISCNWIRFNTEKMMSKKTIEHKFIKQKIVFTGGGMLFKREVANKIVSYKIDKWLFDDVQFSINSYINGYENYRYLGSITEHNIVTKGGIKTLYNETQMKLNDKRLIKLETAKNSYKFENSYYMPRDSNLTDIANKLHIQNKI